MQLYNANLAEFYEKVSVRTGRATLKLTIFERVVR